MKRKLDEREKMELLKMEQAGFWILFIGLVISILIQLFLLHARFAQIAGETVVLFAGGAAVIAGGIHNGQERFGVKHRLQKSILFGLITAVTADVILGIVFYFWTKGQSVNIKELVTTLVVSFVVIWLLAFVTLFFMEAAAHKKQKKLNELYSEGEEEE